MAGDVLRKAKVEPTHSDGDADRERTPVIQEIADFTLGALIATLSGVAIWGFGWIAWRWLWP
jgi:hypothetical protein